MSIKKINNFCLMDKHMILLKIIVLLIVRQYLRFIIGSKNFNYKCNWKINIYKSNKIFILLFSMVIYIIWTHRIINYNHLVKWKQYIKKYYKINLIILSTKISHLYTSTRSCKKFQMKILITSLYRWKIIWVII